MYSTHLEFHRPGDDLPASVWLLLFQTKAQDNRTAVFLSRRPPPYAPFSEIWSYRPAAVASACMQCIQFDDHTWRFVCLSVVWLIGYEYAAFLHGGWNTESGLICWSSRQPRCWPWVWRRVRGRRPSLAASEGCTGGVTAQLATLEKVILCIIRTPNFKTILEEKKCVLYPRFYGMYTFCTGKLW